MAIQSFDRDGFETTLKRVLSPTTPIRSPEFLRGRHKKLEEIRRSLIQPGRHIFIYGDRGVGKTSLAQTAAYEHQTASQEPILLGCDPSSTFYGIAQDIVSRLLSTDPTVIRRINSTKGNAIIAALASIEAQQTVERGKIAEMHSINDAISAVNFFAKQHSSCPVIVIDEFERIENSDQRTLFADFIKQLGDQSVPLRLIFCGVGRSLEELLDAHHSCYRYLSAVGLERLSYDPRLEIIDGAIESVSLTVDATTRYRIATISDGFPHYVHLLTEKLLWEAFDDERPVSQIGADHFVGAVKAAVLDIEPHLKAAYEKATLKYNNDYEEVLWAVADHHELKRRSSDVFECYQRIMQSRGETPLSRDKFNQRMNTLKKPAHGEILRANRQGWYEFREAIVRGYVRLRAEDKGISLGKDHPLETRRVQSFLGTY